MGEKAGQVGKVLKRLYSERYGVQASINIPKRNTELFCGENTVLVPIFSEKSHYDVYVRGPFSSLKDDGLTVFQKF